MASGVDRSSRIRSLEEKISALQSELKELIDSTEKELEESFRASPGLPTPTLKTSRQTISETPALKPTVRKVATMDPRLVATFSNQDEHLGNSSKPSDTTCGVGKPSEIKPSVFKGSEQEDWIIWLRNYEQVASLNGWSEKFKLARISTVLEGEANLKYWECAAEERGDWRSLVQALSSKFAPDSTRATFQAALETRIRKKDESLDSFMSAIKTLARKAFPEWDNKYRDIMIRKYFLDGLEENFRVWVLQANPKTADDALQVALRTEANLQKKTSNPTCNMTQAAAGLNTSELAEAIVLALEKRGVGSSERHHGEFENRGNGGQYRGGGRGHYRGGGRGQFGGSGRARGTRGNAGTCHSCGQSGHFWRDRECPNSPYHQGNGRGAGGW